MNFLPRVPEATIHNKNEFCAKYISCYGGDYNNALRSWQVDVLENTKRKLLQPFPEEELRKAGVIE